MENKSFFDACGFGITTLDYICIVNKLANYQRQATIENVKFFGGGCVSTALVALSRLGAKTALISTLGDDWAAKEVLSGLKEENIDCGGIGFLDDQLTTFSFIQVNKNHGKRAICYYPGSGANLKLNNRAKEIIKTSKTLLLDGLIKSESVKAAKFAKENNIKVMLDCNVLNEDIPELLPFIDYLITSESFLYDYAKTRNIEDALARLYGDYRPQVLVTTLGKKGSVALVDGDLKYVDVFNVKVKDTTGCGDVYHGAFLYGLLRKWDIADIMVFATAVSSIKAMHYGGRPGIPGLKETFKFLKKHGVKTEKFF